MSRCIECIQRTPLHPRQVSRHAQQCNTRGRQEFIHGHHRVPIEHLACSGGGKEVLETCGCRVEEAGWGAVHGCIAKMTWHSVTTCWAAAQWGTMLLSLSLTGTPRCCKGAVLKVLACCGALQPTPPCQGSGLSLHCVIYHFRCTEDAKGCCQPAW